MAAAKTLAAAFVDSRTLESASWLLAGRRALLAPVHAIEDQGINRIPAAFAELLSERTGLDVAPDIIQANVVSHTGASGWERIVRPPVFDGPVQAGERYLLVDDFVGQGGTLANLRGFLIEGGGEVTGAMTLTGKGLFGQTNTWLRNLGAASRQAWHRTRKVVEENLRLRL